ncbi:hypothetical protein FKM82_030939 [Ascaphus truei]
MAIFSFTRIDLIKRGTVHKGLTYNSAPSSSKINGKAVKVPTTYSIREVTVCGDGRLCAEAGGYCTVQRVQGETTQQVNGFQM